MELTKEELEQAKRDLERAIDNGADPALVKVDISRVAEGDVKESISLTLQEVNDLLK